MGQVLLSTTILASFLGGMVALLAPCCVSVMLPAFFASSFRRRGQILAMTLVFAAGVGTIILPIALGAAAISRVLIGYHLWVFSIVGLVMLAIGIATLAGWKMMLPVPSGRGGGGKGIGSFYGLGVFSGIASACCAPVLAGVAALSGAASSLPAAAAVGIAYVFGMVAPLCALALVWDRKKWGSSRLLAARMVPIWPGSQKRILLSTLLSGVLMIGMGVLTIVIAIQGPGMAPAGWQVEITAILDHAASSVVKVLGFIPGWVFTVVIFAALAALLGTAIRSRKSRAVSQPRTTEGDGCGACSSSDGSASTALPDSFVVVAAAANHVHPKEH